MEEPKWSSRDGQTADPGCSSVALNLLQDEVLQTEAVKSYQKSLKLAFLTKRQSGLNGVQMSNSIQGWVCWSSDASHREARRSRFIVPESETKQSGTDPARGDMSDSVRFPQEML